MIGFIGGTGPEGRGLALRFALAGEQVSIGSRHEGRAREAARNTAALAPSLSMAGGLNSDVAGRADVAFITIPYAAQRGALEALKGPLEDKVVVSVVAPVTFSNGVARAVRVAEGSAALQAQALLPGSAVVGAFQTISAHDLLVPDRPIDSDVVVCADDPEAKDKAMRLAEKIQGVRAVDGGGLENAVYVENFTALLMNINRRYKARSALKIAGI